MKKLPRKVTLKKRNLIAFGVFTEEVIEYILWSYCDGCYLATNLNIMEVETLDSSLVDDGLFQKEKNSL